MAENLQKKFYVMSKISRNPENAGMPGISIVQHRLFYPIAIPSSGYRSCTSGHGLVSHCPAMDRPYMTYALLAIEILFFVKNKYTQSNIKNQVNMKHVGT